MNILRFTTHYLCDCHVVGLGCKVMEDYPSSIVGRAFGIDVGSGSYQGPDDVQGGPLLVLTDGFKQRSPPRVVDCVHLDILLFKGLVTNSILVFYLCTFK